MNPPVISKAQCFRIFFRAQRQSQNLTSVETSHADRRDRRRAVRARSGTPRCPDNAHEDSITISHRPQRAVMSRKPESKQLETPQLIRWRDVGGPRPVSPRSRMQLDNFRSLNSNNASRSNNTRGTSEEKSEARDGRSDEATREHRGQPRRHGHVGGARHGPSLGRPHAPRAHTRLNRKVGVNTVPWVGVNTILRWCFSVRNS